ncbi:MAG: hypothetical protein PHO65_01100 [Sulfurovum sp.]|nr:hypothetical protein [Sulfurovum sp.]
MKLFFCLIIIFSSAYSLEFEKKQEFITILNTQDNGNKQSYVGNVIQGLASFGDLWVTTQTVADRFLIVNFLDKKGNSIYHERVLYQSHGQDLSIEYNKADKLLHLYTVATNWAGIAKITYSLNNVLPQFISIDEYNLNCNHCTSSISEDKKFFAIRDKNKIYVYDKDRVIRDQVKTALLHNFKLHKEQRKKGLWFQGIAMKDNLIYCLSSDNSLGSDKFLFVYDLSGKVVFVTKLTAGKEMAILEGDKYEFEGLTFKNNSLYTTVMSGKKGKNIKRLYKILEIIP